MRLVVCSLIFFTIVSLAPLSAAISFGSRKSALEVSAGSLAFSANSVGLTKGTIRKTGSGNFTGDAGEYLDCTKMRIETDHSTTYKGVGLDGLLYLNDATITLEDSDVLSVDGGQVAETVTVNGAVSVPSTLQGFGSFAAGISVNSTRKLVMRWDSEMAQDLTLNSTTAGTTTLLLEQDLRFAPGYSVEAGSETGTAQIDFNGYSMTVGGVTIGALNQTWVDANLNLTGNTTISADITLSGNAALINCHGHTLSITGATAGSVGGTISNGTLGSFDSGVLAGTGNWTLRNIVLDDGAQKIGVPSGVLTGGTADVFAGDATWQADSIIELHSDFDLQGEWTFSGACSIIGNGKSINFNDASSIIDYDATVTIRDVKLTNVVKESFDNDGAADLYLSNVEWHDDVANGGGSIRINASPLVDSACYATLSLAEGGNGEDGLLFDDTTDDTARINWDNGARIDLLSNVDLNTTWKFGDKSVINGHGFVINLVGGAFDFDADLYLNDIILAEVDAAAFDNAGAKDLFLGNVIWMDNTAEGMIHIIGNTEVTEHGAAQVSLATTNSGNLFSTAVSWDNGVNMEILKGVTFNSGGAWTFSEDSRIQGNGNLINFNSVATPMTVAAGKTLSISDAVITGWGAGEIILGAGATLELSNVTIIMDGNYSTTLTGETIRVNGECTFITGSYVFDASTGSNEINGVTLWVDTLGRGRNSNVKFGSFTGTGRVSYQPETAWEPAYFDSAANYMTSSLLLHYDIDASVDTMGKNVFLLTDTEFTLQGGGRSMYMGNIPGSDATATKLLTVVGSNTMEIQDTSFVGWNEAHISDGSNLIRYGNGCVIRLLSDQTLTSNIYVSNATSGDTVTVDLNGHELIMDSDSSAFNIANTDVNLIIKNGRIMKLNDNGSTTKFLLNSGTSSTVTFQDVEMVLNGATRMLGNNVTFKGKCKITGTGDNTLSFYGTSVTIAAGAHLTFDKGMTLKLEDTSPTITFGSASSTLELFGATFDVSALASAPTFTTGTLLIDDKVTLAGDMTLGGSGASDLDIILQPAASLEITSGTITYGNSS